jgi:PhnB protein
MQLVHVYLNFPGTTEEAVNFYAEVFGTKVLAVMRFGDAPFVKGVTDAVKQKVMHAQVPISEAVHLMASDSVEGMGPPLKPGNNFHVSVVAKDRAEADRAFTRLREGGSVQMPIANAPWGPYYGMCTDRFGVQWMVSLPHPV